MTNPFDAAIEAIDLAMEYGGYWERHTDELTVAKRVLKAAGEITEDDINRGVHGYVDRSVTNLLEAIDSALPDKEKP